MIAFVLVFLVVFLTVYLYICINKRLPNFPPGPPKLPFWGSYWFMLKENYLHPHLSLEILSKKYKTDILGLYLGNAPTVITFNIELCKELLTRDEFIGRNDTIITRSRGLGEMRGIFFTDGPYWKNERRFTLRHMRDYGFGRRSERLEHFLEDEIRHLIDIIRLNEIPKDLQDVCRGKGECLLPDLLFAPLLNSIFLILSSTRFDDKKLREIGRLALEYQRSGDVTGTAISMTPWLRYLAPEYFGYTTAIQTNDYLIDFLREVLDEHLSTPPNENCRDLIDDYVLEHTNNGTSDFDYNQLLLILLDYMFPAANAIGHTLSFFFAYLMENSQVQTKIQEEIDRVVEHSRLPNLDDRKNMPYLEAALREAIRIHPINPLGIPRRCMQDTTLAGYFIPKDTIMLPCVWTAHRDPRVWDKPEQFRPERYLGDDGKLIRKDITMGFGGGKRLCAGETFARQNMFLIVSGLLQSFTIKSLPNAKKLEVVPGVNLSFRELWVIAEEK